MIREAEPQDQEAIQSLYRILAPEAPVKVLAEKIAEIKNDPHNFLFVDETEGNVWGTIFLTICLSPMFGGQPFGVIEYFVVDEKCRRQGIGSQLIDYVIAVCREKKCTRVILLCSAERQAAHAFYEVKGFDGLAKKGFVKYLNRKSN
jgi:GNAT superfamily N-acetyltransferase